MAKNYLVYKLLIGLFLLTTLSGCKVIMTLVKSKATRRVSREVAKDLSIGIGSSLIASDIMERQDNNHLPEPTGTLEPETLEIEHRNSLEQQNRYSESSLHSVSNGSRFRHEPFYDNGKLVITPKRMVASIEACYGHNGIPASSWESIPSIESIAPRIIMVENFQARTTFGDDPGFLCLKV